MNNIVEVTREDALSFELTEQEKAIADEVRKTMLALEVRILHALYNGGKFNIKASTNSRIGSDVFTLTIESKK